MDDVAWLVQQCASYVQDPDGHRQRTPTADAEYRERMARGVEEWQRLQAETKQLRVATRCILSIARDVVPEVPQESHEHAS